MILLERGAGLPKNPKKALQLILAAQSPQKSPYNGIMKKK